MRDVTARTTALIPPTDTTGRGRQVGGIMPAGGLTETMRQTTSAEDPSRDAISFCLPIKWRLTVCTRYGYPKPTHQCGASGGRGGHARPAEGWRAEPAIALGELVEPCATTLTVCHGKVRADFGKVMFMYARMQMGQSISAILASQWPVESCLCCCFAQSWTQRGCLIPPITPPRGSVAS